MKYLQNISQAHAVKDTLGKHGSCIMIEFNKSLSLIKLFIHVTAASEGVTHTQILVFLHLVVYMDIT